MSGALAFVPLPGLSAVAGPAKVAFAIGFTLALSAQWPTVEAQSVTASTLAAWAGAEAAIGVAIGVSVTIVLEAFTLSAQVLGLQAGYAFAQTIDPNTQADSGILLVLAQLLGGMFFFAMGLDRQSPAPVRPEPRKDPGGHLGFRPQFGGIADSPRHPVCFPWASVWRCRSWPCW